MNGAYEAPVPAPDGWLVLDPDSQQATLDKWLAADAMVLGRKTYEGLAGVWPQMTEVPGMEAYAARMNGMPKYVASRTLSGDLPWNATVLEGEVAARLIELKGEHDGDLIVSGAGELARHLIAEGAVDELWLTVCPYLWGDGPRIFVELGAVPLELLNATTYSSGAVRLSYRPVPETTSAMG
ncbi:deaminase [cyanobacterium TDX16]|nr:deaminase [cyanobacterium TDX16]